MGRARNSLLLMIFRRESTATSVPCHFKRTACGYSRAKSLKPSMRGRKLTIESSDNAATVGRKHGTGKLLHNGVKPNELTLRQFHPEIGIESRRGNALKDRGGHPNYLKPNAFLSECVNKPCERRNCSCVLHLSSGVMVRLRAKRTRSHSLSALTFLRRRSSSSNFFLFTEITMRCGNCPVEICGSVSRQGVHPHSTT